MNGPIEVSEKPKLRTYTKFKTHFGTEPYVDHNLSRTQRSTLAKFRTGILPLRIETGRWACPRLSPEERLCQVCNSGAVEDEAHFAFHCTRYNARRNRFYRQLNTDQPFTRLSTEDKLCNIMKPENIELRLKSFVIFSFY